MTPGSPSLSPFISQKKLDRFNDLLGPAIKQIRDTYCNTREVVIMEAICRANKGTIPEDEDEVCRRGHIFVTREGIYQLQWDGKPVVEWRMENFRLECVWLMDDTGAKIAEAKIKTP